MNKRHESDASVSHYNFHFVFSHFLHYDFHYVFFHFLTLKPNRDALQIRTVLREGRGSVVLLAVRIVPNMSSFGVRRARQNDTIEVEYKSVK